MGGNDHKPGGRRKARGFAPLANSARTSLGKAGAARGFAERRLIVDWASVVGAEIAAICAPARISYGRRERSIGATLIVEASGARAFEAQHLAPVILERVNQAYGYRAVTRVKVSQSAGLSGATPSGPAPEFRRNSELEVASATDISPEVEAVRDPDLRAALTELERGLRRRAAKRREEKPE